MSNIILTSILIFIKEVIYNLNDKELCFDFFSKDQVYLLIENTLLIIYLCNKPLIIDIKGSTMTQQHDLNVILYFIYLIIFII